MADDRNAEILSRLDVLSEYELLGVKLASDAPRASGMIECYAIDRDEKKPSAWIQVNTGRYGDSKTGANLSLWEFAVKFGKIGLKDWKEARDHYARKAGAEPAAPAGKGRKPRTPKAEKPDAKLEFIPWDAGHERLATVWCKRHKKGTSLEAIKLSGGRVAYYPCFTDRETKKKVRGNCKVIAIPCYGEKLLAADPVAWVLWDITGKPLKVNRGKDKPPDLVKMKSVGPTRGAMMGKAGLEILSDPSRRAGVVCVIKTAGPSDMLAMIANQDPAHRDIVPIITNASTETGDILSHQVELLSGTTAIVMHDDDEAGSQGEHKWRNETDGKCDVLTKKRNPGELAKKHGNDVRDFLVRWAKSLEERTGGANV